MARAFWMIPLLAGLLTACPESTTNTGNMGGVKPVPAQPGLVENSGFTFYDTLGLTDFALDDFYKRNIAGVNVTPMDMRWLPNKPAQLLIGLELYGGAYGLPGSTDAMALNQVLSLEPAGFKALIAPTAGGLVEARFNPSGGYDQIGLKNFPDFIGGSPLGKNKYTSSAVPTDASAGEPLANCRKCEQLVFGTLEKFVIATETTDRGNYILAYSKDPTNANLRKADQLTRTQSLQGMSVANPVNGKIAVALYSRPVDGTPNPKSKVDLLMFDQSSKVTTTLFSLEQTQLGLPADIPDETPTNFTVHVLETKLYQDISGIKLAFVIETPTGLKFLMIEKNGNADPTTKLLELPHDKSKGVTHMFVKAGVFYIGISDTTVGGKPSLLKYVPSGFTALGKRGFAVTPGTAKPFVLEDGKAYVFFSNPDPKLFSVATIKE